MLTLHDAIRQRHSVRSYLDKPLEPHIIETLQTKISECNTTGSLNIQLVTGEAKAFHGLNGYGKFHGVTNYLIMAGKKAHDLDERVGYYGEQIVLLAQQLGLNTCWVGLTYGKTKGAFTLNDGEKVVCAIALGYGATQGIDHKRKTVAQVSNATSNSPQWFIDGIDAALLAPTAINQQKFSFELLPTIANGKAQVVAHRGFSLVGYTQLDLGIARLHFEIGAGKENFEWAK